MHLIFFSLGNCSFESSPRRETHMRRFEAELAQQCEKLVSCSCRLALQIPITRVFNIFFLLQVIDLDRKIRRGRERLAQDVAVPPPVIGKTSEQLSIIEEKVKKLLEQIEELGEAGKVDEAEALMRKVLSLKIHFDCVLLSNASSLTGVPVSLFLDCRLNF